MLVCESFFRLERGLLELRLFATLLLVPSLSATMTRNHNNSQPARRISTSSCRVCDELVPMPTARDYFAPSEAGKHIYAAGGTDGKRAFNSVSASTRTCPVAQIAVDAHNSERPDLAMILDRIHLSAGSAGQLNTMCCWARSTSRSRFNGHSNAQDFLHHWKVEQHEGNSAQWKMLTWRWRAQASKTRGARKLLWAIEQSL